MDINQANLAHSTENLLFCMLVSTASFFSVISIRWEFRERLNFQTDFKYDTYTFPPFFVITALSAIMKSLSFEIKNEMNYSRVQMSRSGEKNILHSWLIW